MMEQKKIKTHPTLSHTHTTTTTTTMTLYDILRMHTYTTYIHRIHTYLDIFIKSLQLLYYANVVLGSGWIIAYTE
jgi:hypothetical protein